MAFTSIGLPNGGKTAHFHIGYEDSLSQADGLNRANALFAKCEQDFTLMQQWFGGRDLKFKYPIPVHIANGSSGGSWSDPPDAAFIFGRPSPTITISQNGASADVLRYLLVSEVTEMFMATQDRGWYESTGLFHGADEGSKGEGLSRFLGIQFQLANGLGSVPPAGFGVTYLWLNSSARGDFVDFNPDDINPDAVTGCTTLFLYYLHDQLGFGIKSIIDAAASSLAEVYKNLTGRHDGWAQFMNLINSHYPPGTTYNPPSDNLFPVAELIAFSAPNQITCGYNAPANVFISLPAMAEVKISLSSDDPALVQVPASVTILPGSTLASVNISTTALPLPFAKKVVKLHARYAGQTRDITVEVTPPRVVSVTLSPDTVVCGNDSTGTVTLDRPSLLGPVVVEGICGSPGFATVPEKIIIPQNQLSAQFTITTRNIFIPFVPAHVTIMASYEGSFAEGILTINPKVIAGIIRSLTLFPATVVGGNPSTGFVTLESAVPTPTVVGLAAQEMGPGPGGGGTSFIASVPPSIIIPAGQTSGIFQISTAQIFFPEHIRTAIIVAAATTTKYAGLKVTT